MDTLTGNFIRNMADPNMNTYTFEDLQKFVDDPTQKEYLEDLISDYCENDILDKTLFLLDCNIKPYCYPVFPSIEMCRLLCTYKVFPSMKIMIFWVERRFKLIEVIKCYNKFTIYEIIDLVYQDVYNLRSNMLNIFIDEIDNFTESDRQALINKVPDPIKDNIKNVLQTSYEYAQYRKRLLKKYGRIWFYKWLENSSNPQGCPKYITPYNPQGFGTQYIKFKKEAEELYN